MPTAMEDALKRSGFNIQAATLAGFVYDLLKRTEGDTVQAARKLESELLKHEGWIADLCHHYVSWLEEDRSGNALYQGGGQSLCSRNGHSTAFSNPDRNYVHPSLQRWNGRAGQEMDAYNGPVNGSRPADMRGHNHPPRHPAIDPAKFARAQQTNKQQLAETIIDKWTLSDGQQVCKLPLYELKRRDEDGIASRVLREAALNKYANLDETQAPEDLLSKSELESCLEKTKQLRAKEIAA